VNKRKKSKILNTLYLENKTEKNERGSFMLHSVKPAFLKNVESAHKMETYRIKIIEIIM